MADGTVISQSSDGFTVVTDAMHSGICEMEKVLASIGSTAEALAGTVLSALAFGQIGQATAAGNAQLSGTQNSAISSWMDKLSQYGQLLGTVLASYEQADTQVAQSFGGTARSNTQAAQTATAQTTKPADPVLAAAGTLHFGDRGASVTTLQNQLNAAGYNVGTADGVWGMRTTAALAQYAHDHNLTLPAQSGQVDPSVVQSIMHSEGATGNQGGVPELYGFRQSSHNGYDAILAARNQYGEGSAGETAAVSQAISNEASRSGATQFTDPGTQAAIISSAHMRGPGGTMAILNSMADGQTSNYTDGSLNATTVSTLSQLTPAQFQQQFHDARVNYDLDHYIDGGRVDNGAHGTVSGDRYWNGLQSRYDREQQQFLQLSPGQN